MVVYIFVCVWKPCVSFGKKGEERIFWRAAKIKKKASHRLQHLVIQVKHTHKYISAADGDLVDKLKNAKKKIEKERESRVFFVSRKKGKEKGI